mgnify:FL=1
MNEDAKKRIERMKLQMLARAKAFWEEDGKAKKKELKLGPDEDPLLAVKIEPKRSYIAFGCITAFLCVLVGRAFYLQCGLGTKFLQHQGEIRFARTLTVPAVRGRILDPCHDTVRQP